MRFEILTIKEELVRNNEQTSEAWTDAEFRLIWSEFKARMKGEGAGTKLHEMVREFEEKHPENLCSLLVRVLLVCVERCSSKHDKVHRMSVILANAMTRLPGATAQEREAFFRVNRLVNDQFEMLFLEILD